MGPNASRKACDKSCFVLAAGNKPARRGSWSASRRSAGPRATKIGVVSLKALDHHRPNREESFIRIRLQSSSTTHRFGPIAERHGPADPRFEAAILSRTRSPSSQRARAKVDEGPFASLNATRRKLPPGTWLAISALHLIENRLDVAAVGLQRQHQRGDPGSCVGEIV